MFVVCFVYFTLCLHSMVYVWGRCHTVLHLSFCYMRHLVELYLGPPHVHKCVELKPAAWQPTQITRV